MFAGALGSHRIIFLFFISTLPFLLYFFLVTKVKKKNKKKFNELCDVIKKNALCRVVKCSRMCISGYFSNYCRLKPKKKSTIKEVFTTFFNLIKNTHHNLFLSIITNKYNKQNNNKINLILIWNNLDKSVQIQKKTMKSRTKQSSSISSASKTAACSDSPKGAYPSISAAYWLPAPNTTPYLLPGKSQYMWQ